MSKIDEMQSDIELKAFFIEELENKIALLERKLAKAVDQRNSLIYPDNDNYYELTSIFNKELAELK